MATKVSQIWLNTTLGLGMGLFAAPTIVSTPAMAVELSTEAFAIASDQTQLDSVLVATRRATAEESERNSVPLLEPISQVSEFEPELADPYVATATDQKDRLASLPNRKSASAKTDKEQARFHGVQAGVTTLDELLSEWGEPTSRHDLEENASSEILQYDIEPFANVETLVNDDTIEIVRVTLATPSSVEGLVETLGLEEFESVEVIDPTSGDLLAISVPEKGLTMLTEKTNAPVAGNISHLVLQTLDSQAFALRAEMRGPAFCTKSLADLNRAISIDAENAHARWLKAKRLRFTGQAEAAEKQAAESVRLDGTDSAYLLLWAQTLADLDRHDEAVLKTRQVIDETKTEAVRAEAYYTMGLLSAYGDAKIAEKAINFHNSAITIADKIATSKDDLERRAAKDLLINAHLAIAKVIAEREYPDKTETVAQWIGRASGLAEERIQNDGGGLELRLLVARGALSALASLRPALDPTPWIEEAEETVRLLRSEVSDPLFLAKIDWELGLAHQQAVRIEHARGEADKAIEQGSKSIESLSAGAEPRVTLPSAEQTVGELYFYLGAINAVHVKNHTEAVGWYDKARPLYETERPASDFRVERKLGEKYVSMAVSYWEEGQNDLAIELTTKGSELMKQAVEAGVLKRSALAVPYGNLRTMHRELGNKAKASSYEALYVSHGGKVTPKPIAKSPTTGKPAKTARKPSNSTQRTARLGRPTARGTLTR